jgi:hypothetical protein
MQFVWRRRYFCKRAVLTSRPEINQLAKPEKICTLGLRLLLVPRVVVGSGSWRHPTLLVFSVVKDCFQRTNAEQSGLMPCPHWNLEVDTVTEDVKYTVYSPPDPPPQAIAIDV